MRDYQSLNHTTWDCKYPVVFIAKRRKKAIFGAIRKHLGKVLHELAVQKGCLEAMAHGPVAGFPLKGVRVTLFDGSYHTVDSSEQAFKTAGSIAMKQAMENAGAVLLEPIMIVTLSVPEDSVGDVIGDLNSRRGRPQGMEPSAAGMTEVKAEVPMAEMLSYAPDLRSITGGQGEFTMEFLRYEEIPAHLAQKVVKAATEETVSA